MSEFSDNFALSWDTSVQVFGDQCIINGVTIDCVIHGFELSDSIQNGRPGRTTSANGTVIIKDAKWIEVGGRKGTQVTIGTTTYRVLNDPSAGYTADTVELQLGPLV